MKQEQAAAAKEIPSGFSRGKITQLMLWRARVFFDTELMMPGG
jgi:hypothetical protein